MEGRCRWKITFMKYARCYLLQMVYPIDRTYCIDYDVALVSNNYLSFMSKEEVGEDYGSV